VGQMCDSGAPPLGGEVRDGDARLDRDGGYQRLPAAGIPPGCAHLGLDDLAIKRLPHRLGDGGAEQRALYLGDTAAE
jgi:hypothetical protein